jgi:hypothetical protein
MSEILNGERLEHIVKDCLYREDELDTVSDRPTIDDVPEGAIVAEGILNTFAFHPERLHSYQEEIWQMLNELPEAFWIPDDEHPNGGGGWSFLNACMDRHDEQWTSFHRTMDQLFSLGQALGFVTSALPRDLWSSLPGGMPYYSIHGRRSDVTES